jgi:hypothetical protein
MKLCDIYNLFGSGIGIAPIPDLKPLIIPGAHNKTASHIPLNVWPTSNGCNSTSKSYKIVVYLNG